MENIKTHTFEFYSTGNPPEWWSYEYFPDDLSVGIKQPFTSERSCMERVLVEEGLLDEDTCRILTMHDLERTLLDNKIYVKFVEGEYE